MTVTFGRLGLDVEQLEVAEQVGVGLAAVVDLDDVRLVPVVAEQVEPALEAVGVEQVADDDASPRRWVAVDEARSRRAPGRSRRPAARALRGTSAATGCGPCRGSAGSRRRCRRRTRRRRRGRGRPARCRPAPRRPAGRSRTSAGRRTPCSASSRAGSRRAGLLPPGTA